MLTIEKDVPVPQGRMGLSAAFPFGEMKVGDSFFVPPGFTGRGDKLVTVVSVSSAAASYGRHHGIKFAVRRDGDGIRVWRKS